MILGVGHDLVHLPRFRQLLNTRSPHRVSRLAQRILHPEYERPRFEAKLADPLSLEDSKSASFYLANSWACKEALYKSLGPLDQRNCRFNHWYKTHTADGKPIIQCDEYARLHPDEQFFLSISHDGDYLSTFIIRSLMK